MQGRKPLCEQSGLGRVLGHCTVLPSCLFLAPERGCSKTAPHGKQRAHWERSLVWQSAALVYVPPLLSWLYLPHKVEEHLPLSGHSLDVGASCGSVTPGKAASLERPAGSHHCAGDHAGAGLPYLGTVLGNGPQKSLRNLYINSKHS